MTTCECETPYFKNINGKVIHEDMVEAIDLITRINNNTSLEKFPLTHEDNFRGHTHVYRVGNPNPIRVQRSSIFREEENGNNRVYKKEVIVEAIVRYDLSGIKIYTFKKSVIIIEGFKIDCG